MNHLYKIGTLFLVGAGLYWLIECMWRHTWANPIMAVIGGLCFVLVGTINETFSWEMPLWVQTVLATIIVLTIEFDSGVILNLWIGLHIWDYSNVWGNLYGQICPQFAIAWFGLSVVGIVLDDVLRWKLFGEERPHYRII